MANEEHLAILQQGAKVWNQWRAANPNVEPTLSWINLTEVNLSEANLTDVMLEGANLHGLNLHGFNLVDTKLSWANLAGANLAGAYLRGTNLTGTDLTNANLSGARLERADFVGTGLERADLSGARLEEANFSGTRLQECLLDEAVLDRTTFADVDLRGVRGLATVHHQRPSHINFDTLYRSQGDIPESFLRRCGVPDNMIEYARSLIAAVRPIDYYSVFISYSSHDAALAQRLHADLQVAGVRCWYAPHDLPIGARIHVGIDEAIRLHDKLLLLLSKHSVGSDWVEKEVETAMEQERREKRTVLFPIRLDTTVMKVESGWAADVRRGRNIGDFTKWKQHDNYQQAFQRLLRDLQAQSR